MIKKILLALLLSLSLALPVFAESSNPIDESGQYSGHLYIFHSETCPHCKEELAFLVKISKEEAYQDVQFLEFEITQHPENSALLQEVGRVMDADTSGVPFTVIGNQIITGYLNDDTTGQQIRNALDKIIKDGDSDIVGSIIKAIEIDSPTVEDQQSNEQIDNAAIALIPETLTLPVFGTIETANVSLPILSTMLGLIDGFNPCAMWTLVFLITLLFGMKDKRRMWILGGTFIIASGVVYYIFMAAWLNILIFLGFLFAVRLIIGLVAIGGGAYSIHDFYTNKDAECKVGDLDEKQKTMTKMRNILSRPSFIMAFLGMVVLAVAVNLVELICSAGIPAVYTQILTMSGISAIGRYLYMLWYIFFYMFDDIVVFIIAMLTLQITGMTTKYTRATRLIGGIIMLIIGVLMILKPEWLTFG
ncbi:MAG: hypothetical protein ACD_66C00135G0001 [uncultured bacterium]|uniref:Thioredoxin domain-containing protein n=1 Tax=Candidatus Uhrbacteria bacterium GW2011_GWC1_41_20 TaxID=1618983 RepID=A0A0G0VET8_9BACT|nr:MAG: hypothetical protein ACD_66C00135G0001 [uncultured bacterium]KKR22924.1 MAG: hypothetical protein UT52_C0005G0029 [Candidatus Uhrbacteria bacterium GW2011_GWE1_39_46]KKR63623.1 MAG: hypothetical protein UU04_C0015G0012 [Candidatus Uhrbacteria bacterium GW2011_GWC2_40_450]KKR96395.1 MAG: hypothetical protein UU46_C0003G0012 [Candidatus Uhrbacteria bacterium GW2011_GWD1_41_16]KKR99409.1 MAG: hypothetical protein UU50_C0006G0012 [Candidatus Uhrbacteria bacterium GW2011_GWC1_41_20]KKS08359